MFKNLIVYRIGAALAASLPQIEAALDKERFAECGASQEMSMGWTEPRGVANGPLLEAVGGQLLLKLMFESKAVPTAVIKRKVEERLTQIEATTGRKPGKKERKEISEDVKLSLLPMAFAKRGAVQVWIDPEARMLVLDAGSQGRADETITALVKSIDGLQVLQLNTAISPATAMANWLTTQEPPAGFTVDRECELKAADESKSVVKYGRHALDIDEVRQHVADGKLPTKLALTWDDRVSFILTEGLQLKKITFLEGVFDGTSQEKEDGFDADAAICTGELKQLIPDLLAALGGEMALGEAGTPAAPAAAHSTVFTHVDGEPDPLYEKAVALVKEHQKASISLVQRYLQIGYNRAARLVEDMEKAGLVSAMCPDGTRSLLVSVAA